MSQKALPSPAATAAAAWALASLTALGAVTGTARAEEATGVPPTTTDGASAPVTPASGAPTVPPTPASPPQPSAAAPPAAAVPAPGVLTIALPPPPTDAALHVKIDRPGAWIEGRSRVDRDEWRKLCPAPCDRTVRVEGLELRVTAPGMSPSNAFLIDPGAGVARFRVAPGSSLHRDLGVIGLAAGLPVTFLGMSLFGLGTLGEHAGERTAGLVTLSAGAVMIAVALPLLLSGSTNVKDAAGKVIASAGMPRSF